MKEARDLLSKLTESLKFATKELHRRTKASIVHHRFAVLPTEILADIIEMVCLSQRRRYRRCDDVGHNPELEIGSVCKRFREVSLRLPSLWSRIRFVRSHEWLKIQLERSVDFPLTVEFDDQVYGHAECTRESACINFVSEMVKHTHRWGRVVLARAHENGSLAKILSNLHLPALKTLILSDQDEFSEDPGYLTNEFIQTWSTPLLRDLTSDRTVFDMQVAWRLQRANLHSGMLDPSALSEITNFLTSRTAEGLVELVLGFSAFSELPLEEGPSSQPTTVVRLRRLRKLSIVVEKDVRNSCQIISHFTECLSIPRVDTISLDLHFERGEKTVYLFLSWLHRIRRPKRMDLTVRLYESFYGRDDFYDEIRRRLEELDPFGQYRENWTAVYVDEYGLENDFFDLPLVW